MMSEEDPTNDPQESETVNRRQALSAIGTTVALSSGLAGVASAEEDSADTQVPSVRELSDSQKDQLVELALQSQVLQRFRNESELLDTHTIDYSSATAYEFSLDDKSRKFVEFRLLDQDGHGSSRRRRHHQESEAGYLGVTFDDEEVENIKAMRTDERGSETVVAEESISAADACTASATHTIDHSTGNITASSNVKAQRCGPSIDKCAICKTVFEFVCKYGCGLSAVGICSAVGFGAGTIGGGACSSLAVKVCKDIDEITDCGSVNIAKYCHRYGACTGMEPIGT